MATRQAGVGLCARRLASLIQRQNAMLRDAVVVVTIRNGLLGEVTETTANHYGRRIVRVRYDWREIEPHAYLPFDRLEDELLRPLASPGEVWSRAESAAQRAMLVGGRLLGAGGAVRA